MPYSPSIFTSQLIHNKEHIYHKHAEANNTCSRCLKSFKTPDQLRNHERKQPACDVRPEGECPDWMTAAQKKEIRSKKRTKHRQTEEQKWGRIYQILFRCDADCIPSPCEFPSDKLDDLGSHSNMFVHMQTTRTTAAAPVVKSLRSATGYRYTTSQTCAHTTRRGISSVNLTVELRRSLDKCLDRNWR